MFYFNVKCLRGLKEKPKKPPSAITHGKTGKPFTVAIFEENRRGSETVFPLRAMDYRPYESKLSPVAFSIALDVVSGEPAPHPGKFVITFR